MRGLNFRRGMEKLAKRKAKAKLNMAGIQPDGATLGKWASTHSRMCSCEMCGNPRNHFGEVSYQEKKFNESADDQLLSDDKTAQMHEDSRIQLEQMYDDINDYALGTETVETIIQTEKVD